MHRFRSAVDAGQMKELLRSSTRAPIKAALQVLAGNGRQWLKADRLQTFCCTLHYTSTYYFSRGLKQNQNDQKSEAAHPIQCYGNYKL